MEEYLPNRTGVGIADISTHPVTGYMQLVARRNAAYNSKNTLYRAKMYLHFMFLLYTM